MTARNSTASSSPTAHPKRTAAKQQHAATPHRWSQHVNETSDAMDLPHDVFKQTDPHKIAQALKRSAEHSDRRKSDPYRSSMSMLTFYINRAGDNLEAGQRRQLEDAKAALRELFGKPAAKPRAARAKPVANSAAQPTSPRAKAAVTARRAAPAKSSRNKMPAPTQ